MEIIATWSTSFASKFKTVKTFLTFNEWNITAALVLTLATDLVAILLGLLEPLSVVCQISYIPALATFSGVTFIEFVVLGTFGGALLLWLSQLLDLFQRQIVMLLVHLLAVFLASILLIISMTTCFPDIHRVRSFSSDYINRYYTYSKVKDLPRVQCSRDINNCYRNHFSALMKVLMISLIVGFCHSLVHAPRMRKNLPPVACVSPQTPTSDYQMQEGSSRESDTCSTGQPTPSTDLDLSQRV